MQVEKHGPSIIIPQRIGSVFFLYEDDDDYMRMMVHGDGQLPTFFGCLLAVENDGDGIVPVLYNTFYSWLFWIVDFCVVRLPDHYPFLHSHTM